MTWGLVAVAGAGLVGAAVGSNAVGDASDAQIAAGNTAAAETRRAADEARADLFKLFPAAQQNAQAGFQGAADIFGQAIPQQADVFQQGNVAAQQQIAAGMPQFQNAILGSPVDFSQFQPQTLQQPDFSFLQQQLPDFIDPFNLTSQQTQVGTANQPVNTGGGANNNPVLPPNVIANLLGGGSTTPQFGAPNLGGFTADRFNLRSRF